MSQSHTPPNDVATSAPGWIAGLSDRTHTWLASEQSAVGILNPGAVFDPEPVKVAP